MHIFKKPTDLVVGHSDDLFYITQNISIKETETLIKVLKTVVKANSLYVEELRRIFYVVNRFDPSGPFVQAISTVVELLEEISDDICNSVNRIHNELLPHLEFILKMRKLFRDFFYDQCREMDKRSTCFFNSVEKHASDYHKIAEKVLTRPPDLNGALDRQVIKDRVKLQENHDQYCLSLVEYRTWQRLVGESSWGRVLDVAVQFFRFLDSSQRELLSLTFQEVSHSKPDLSRLYKQCSSEFDQVALKSYSDIRTQTIEQRRQLLVDKPFNHQLAQFAFQLMLATPDESQTSEAALVIDRHCRNDFRLRSFHQNYRCQQDQFTEEISRENSVLSSFQDLLPSNENRFLVKQFGQKCRWEMDSSQCRVKIERMKTLCDTAAYMVSVISGRLNLLPQGGLAHQFTRTAIDVQRFDTSNGEIPSSTATTQRPPPPKPIVPDKPTPPTPSHPMASLSVARTEALPSIPIRDEAAPPIPARNETVPTLPARKELPPTLPARNGPSPALPARNEPSPALPTRNEPSPALPARNEPSHPNPNPNHNPWLPPKTGKMEASQQLAAVLTGHLECATTESSPGQPPQLPPRHASPPPLSAQLPTQPTQPTKAPTESHSEQTAASQPMPEHWCLPLEDMYWYHGPLSRRDAIILLIQVGDFLVRDSDDKKVLSVRTATQPKHYRFSQNHTTGQWCISNDSGREFPSVAAFIWYHMTNKCSVSSRGDAVIVTPVSKRDDAMENDEFDQIEKLGAGQFGDVYLCFYRPYGIRCAVKSMKNNNPIDMENFRKEALILRTFNHPNIVRLIGCALRCKPYLIALEYCSKGSLKEYLKKAEDEGSSLASSLLLSYCLDISNGMQYLADRGCIHRDLAARNCLIGDLNIVKVADFGMTRETPEYSMTFSKKIPTKWTAPEALIKSTYIPKSDVWSYGIVCWEIFTMCSKPLYPSLKTTVPIIEHLKRGERLPQPSRCPDKLYSLMQRCWHWEPANRPDFLLVSHYLSTELSAKTNVPDSLLATDQ